MPIQYQVRRTYIRGTAGDSTIRRDKSPHHVTGDSARSAALSFINDDGARLLGVISDLPEEDEATACAWREGRVYVILVQRERRSVPRSR